uniref:Uncharacterized protein n=1 Tax=Xenopus tropicalis TaxID=8364 RepID=A0A1B8Y4N1_XENTR
MAAAQPVDTVGELSGLNGSAGNFVDGKFLSVEEVYNCLRNKPGDINEAGRRMIGYIENTIPDEFLQLGVTIPITNLQHVTIQNSMSQIMESECFCAGNYVNFTRRHHNISLSCWSVQVPPDKVEEARREAFQVVQGMVGPRNAREYEGKFNRQFANSPAFNSASRYGNFKFSLPLSDLLSEYKEQHCQGAKPEFRVLGTAMYKQEIAHIVLVHSPMATEFRDLPSVPIVGRHANPLPFVFRSQEDGKFYWRPESTADIFKMRIFENRCRMRECPMSCPYYEERGTCFHCRDTYSIWNHLILAFHLPGNEPLWIPREKLLESLSACDILEPYLREEGTKLTRQEAEEIIRNLQYILVSVSSALL